MPTDLSLTQFTEILAGGTTPKPARQPRYDLGFTFGPRRPQGHVWAIPTSLAAALSTATHAEIVIYGSGALAFGLDLRLQDASGTQGEPLSLVHSPHHDSGHNAPLLTQDAHLLPVTALDLEILAINDAGEAIARKRGRISLGMFRNLNERVRRAQATSFRTWAWSQAVEITKLRREMPCDICRETLELNDAD
jgi:hypothetical protein